MLNLSDEKLRCAAKLVAEAEIRQWSDFETYPGSCVLGRIPAEDAGPAL